MDNDAESLYVRLMLRDKEIIRSLQTENAQLKTENAQLKEVLNKSKSTKK